MQLLRTSSQIFLSFQVSLCSSQEATSGPPRNALRMLLSGCPLSSPGIRGLEASSLALLSLHSMSKVPGQKEMRTEYQIRYTLNPYAHIAGPNPGLKASMKSRSPFSPLPDPTPPPSIE